MAEKQEDKGHGNVLVRGVGAVFQKRLQSFHWCSYVLGQC